MSKHTPGPWEIDAETRSAEVCTVYHTSHPNGFVYVRGALGYLDATPEENMANAHLIAAAPELLDALELALEYWRHRQQRYKNRNPHWVADARAAIAKARGEKDE